MSIKIDPYIKAAFSSFLEIYTGDPNRLSLKTKRVEDKYIKFFQELELDKDNEILLPKGGIAISYSYNGDINIVLLGTSIIEKDLNQFKDSNFCYMEDEGKNPALFLHLAKEFPSHLKLKKENSSEAQVSNILERSIEGDGYEFDILDIISYHNDIYVFNILNESTLAPQNLEEIIILLLIAFPSLLHSGDIEYLEIIKSIIDSEISNNTKYVDLGMMLQSISAYYRRHTFLDIYRCLEKLFYFPEIYELSNKINTNEEKRLDVLTLKSICSESLSWRPTEKDCIIKLLKVIFLDKELSFYDEASRKLCRDFFSKKIEKTNTEINDNQMVEEIAKYIYKYRNSLVHHEDKEYKNTIKKLTEEEWQQIACFIANTLLRFSVKFRAF
ncbi:hypothetical protein HYE60_03745 [Aggregatibacter actinomycetemcomitans]|uniref:hypothetical protein n=1 Tax=Aggregatibacter actinomycetemcomitans TaxID=714 RepID=UPI00197C712E|nr:hypothetical protein [Aggregatibacter actinomycetemcomitans]MBN6074377.1 hypothetical protein [Aggregatibacter actinomycetemcomitans]